MPKIVKAVRPLGIFLLNLLLASIFTDALLSPFAHFNLCSIQSYIVKADFLNAGVAFGLGYYVFRRWRPVSAQWV
jgi:hypothetical protein